MTLIELQVASVLMGIILVMVGVFIITALQSVRILQDAHIVYNNILAAMRSLTTEISRANRYGSMPTLSSAAGPYSLYMAGVEDPYAAPSGWDSSSTELYLRVDSSNPLRFGDDTTVYFGYNESANQLELSINGNSRMIAKNISAVLFHPLAYNAVHVEVEASGNLTDPAGGGPRFVTRVSTIVRLRCAAGESLE